QTGATRWTQQYPVLRWYGQARRTTLERFPGTESTRLGGLRPTVLTDETGTRLRRDLPYILLEILFYALMPGRTETKQQDTLEMPSVTETISTRTVVGWQGIRCVLPPDWNVTRFSMDRDNGSLGIDSPGNGTMTVQIRWSNAASQNKGGSS